MKILGMNLGMKFTLQTFYINRNFYARMSSMVQSSIVSFLPPRMSDYEAFDLIGVHIERYNRILLLVSIFIQNPDPSLTTLTSWQDFCFAMMDLTKRMNWK